MSTNLIDSDTERLAQKIANVTGKSIRTVVREAITAKAEAAGILVTKNAKYSSKELIARMRALSDHCAALPVLDPRPPDEIVGYDEFGIPR
jgi:antitoxin VapB